MSGDVQPRKRKDKKRKREDESVPLSFPPTKEPIEDVNIHVHKDEGTGGGICAKIVFFILFSALIILIGLIITEHRGLTDLDIAESESRYSQIFEGWVDNDKHDDHHTLDDHDNEHFDDEEYENGDGHTLDDHDDEHIDDEPSEEQDHTLDDHDNEHFDDNYDTSTPVSEEEVEEPIGKHNKYQTLKNRYRREVSEEEENVKESQQDDDENVTESQQDDDENATESQQDDDENATESQQDDDQNATESQQDDDEYVTESQQDDDEYVTESLQDDDGDDENVTESQQDEEDETEEEELLAESETREENESAIKEDETDSQQNPEDEEVEKKDNSNDDGTEEYQNYPTPNDVNDINNEDSEENSKNEEQRTEDSQEYQEIKSAVKEDTQEADEIKEPSDNVPETSGVTDNLEKLSMVVKAIIGAAILVVGHFVLVKKWKSDSSDEDTKEDLNKEEMHIDFSRRNTLIPPPPLQEIERDVEYANEEYTYDGREPSRNEEYGLTSNILKEKYEQLRSSYSRSISPESDYVDEDEKTKSEDEAEMDNIDDIEEEEEEIEEEEDQSQDEEIDDENLEGDIEEEEEDYDEEYEEEDDDELMKKLEAKYGKLDPKGREVSVDQEDSDSEKFSDDYEYSTITNEDDWHIHEDLDEAQKKLPDNAAKALKMFEKILEKYPSSPRGLYGFARALDALAEIEKSNELLEEAVTNYLRLSYLKDVPDDLFRIAMERCIDRVRFRGRYGKAITVHHKLMERFPKEPKYRNQLAITYLMIGRVQQASLVLEETLKKWPTNGCALVHYGFIWKTTENDLNKGVYYMQRGMQTGDPCTVDGRFFFHLGDALFRLGHKEKALKLYEEGVKHKLFLSKYQRSLYNVAHLTAKPWWEQNELTRYELLFKDLVKNWQIIRNEGLSVLNEKGYFQDESENLKNTGDWKQFELFARGRKHTKNCYKTPVTCGIIGSHPDASGCKRGQTKFSVMHPGTHVWAHCGPTNCRLRIHLGLKVPPNTFIRVGDEKRSWEDGKLLIFDDSFEHEVWHNGSSARLVLIVDIWHPELSMTERETLSPL